MIRNLLLLLILSLGVAACGGPKDFHVTIDAESVGTQRLTVLYTLPDGNRAVVEPTAVNGHAEFRGNAPEPSLVEIFSSTGKKLTEFHALNGDRIRITFDADGAQIQGAQPAAEPDSITATRQQSDTVRFVAPRVIVGRDTSETWAAEGIWIFTADSKERTRAVMDSIRTNRKRVRDVFVSTEFDTWKELTRLDSATWKQGLLPEGPVDVPALTATPLLLEVDSAGIILRKIKL